MPRPLPPLPHFRKQSHTQMLRDIIAQLRVQKLNPGKFDAFVYCAQIMKQASAVLRFELLRLCDLFCFCLNIGCIVGKAANMKLFN